MTRTVEFMVATDNIRATPPMMMRNVEKCIHRSVRWMAPHEPGHLPPAHQRVTVIGYHEMGNRRLADLYKSHPNWRALQGKRGDRARSALGYDSRVWRVDPKSVQQIKVSNNVTKGGVFVSSGNRYLIEAVLEDIESSIPVVFLALHTIAHVNTGDHFGYTGKGPRALLNYKVLGKPNPAIETYKNSMANLEARINYWRRLELRVVVLGDWNFNAWHDLASRTPEEFAPRRTMERAGVETIYSGHHVQQVKGGPTIDYIGITHNQVGGATLAGAQWMKNWPSDHPLVRAHIRISVPK